MQNTEKTIVKYAVDINLFRLGSFNPKKKSSPWIFISSIFKQKNSKFSTRKIRNVLKRMKYQFSDFYFLNYGQFCTQNCPNLR